MRIKEKNFANIKKLLSFTKPSTIFVNNCYKRGIIFVYVCNLFPKTSNLTKIKP